MRRILEYVVKTPHFRQYAFSRHPNLEEHAQMAREAAGESIVLLKNQCRTLPLKGTERVALYGVTSQDFIAGGTGSGEVKKPYVVNMVQAMEAAGFTLDQRLKKYYEVEAKALQLRFDMEFEEDREHREEPFLTATAIQYQASVNDVAVVVFGRQAGEGKDRRLEEDFELSATEKELLVNLHNAYHPRGKRVVVVLNIGGVIETASWKHLADAIVLPWSPGQEGANAIADILTGKVNPSGKLPMTFPNNYLDIPSSADFPFDYDPFGEYHKKENVDVFYHKDGYEIDFVVVDKTKILELIQVTYKMDTAKTRNRELGGLAKGYAQFKCDKLTLITLNERGDEEFGGAKIKKVTVVDWLLGNVL